MVSPYLLLRECGRGTRARDATWLTLWGGLYSFLGICKTGRSGKMMPWFWVRRGTPCWYSGMYCLIFCFCFYFLSTLPRLRTCIVLQTYQSILELEKSLVWRFGMVVVGWCFYSWWDDAVLMYSCFYLFYFIFFYPWSLFFTLYFGLTLNLSFNHWHRPFNKGKETSSYP